jgi:UDP-glucose 4-epimerase
MEKMLLVGGSGKLAQSFLNVPAVASHIIAHFRPGRSISVSHRDIVQFDLKDHDLAEKNLSKFPSIGALLMFAGVTPSLNGPENFDANTSVANDALELARGLRIPRVILASSASVYGRNSASAADESVATAPISAYARSKVDMELASHRFDDLDIINLRIGNVAGTDALLRQRLDKGSIIKLEQFASGHGPLRSYLSPQLLVDTVCHLATKSGKLPRVLNLAASKPVYMDDLASAAGLKWHFVPAKADSIEKAILDVSTVQKLCDGISFNEGVESFVQGLL